MANLDFLQNCGLLENARNKVREGLSYFGFPYKDTEVDNLISQNWSTGSCDEANVASIVEIHRVHKNLI